MWLLSCYNSKNSRATFLCALPDNPIYKEAEHPRNPGFPPIKSSINLELWELIESRRGWGVSLAWRQWMSYRGTFDIFVIIPDKRTQNVAAKQPGCGFGVEKTKSRNIPHPLMIQIIFFKHWEMLKWCFSEPGVGGRGIKKICITVWRLYESQLHTRSLVVGDHHRHQFIMFCTIFW